MKKRKNNNITIVAENKRYDTGFNIYIDFSGQREYLMTHRHHNDLYQLLSRGISLSELKRSNPSQLFVRHKIRRNGHVPNNSINPLTHLIKVVDWYIKDMEEEKEYYA